MTEGQWNEMVRLVAAAILIAGFAAALIVNWPGHLEYDSVVQLLEGRSGVYSNWHPPVMSWLLGVGDAIMPGAALFVAFDTVMAFGAILSLLWLVQRPAWPAIAVAAIYIALPQLFLFQAIVWKDILFADAMLAGFVLLAHAAFHWGNARARFALLTCTTIFTSFAILTRQNGMLILPCAALALGVIAGRFSNQRRQAILYGAGFFLACMALSICGNAALQLRATKALGAVEQIEDLQLYDIAGMLKLQPRIKLPILEKGSPALANLMQTHGATLYTPAAHDRLSEYAPMGAMLQRPVPAIGQQWRALVVAYPQTYLAVRWQDFSWLFFSRHPDACPVFTVGIDGPDGEMRALKLKPRYDDRDNWLDDNYASPLVGTPAFSHSVFAILDLVCLVLLLRRRRPADIAIAGLLGATALYALSFFVLSIACEYRYLYAIDLSAIAAAFYLLSDWHPRAYFARANATT